MARIGEVARATGLSVQTLRYYERLGLLPPARRTVSGYRVYDQGTEERLRFIQQAKVAGFHLDEIKEILKLRYAGQSPCECVRRLLKVKLEQVEREITEMKRFRGELRKGLRLSEKLRRLPHSASAICPIIQQLPEKKGGEKP